MFATQQLARMRQQELLEEAITHRLAATARQHRRPSRARPPSGGASAWRRAIGWLVINVGVWLAGGEIDPGAGVQGDRPRAEAPSRGPAGPLTASTR